MDFAYRFRLNPTTEQRERLAWTLDTCRQVYNHFLHRMNRTDNTSSVSEQNRLPDLKQWWTDLKSVHSKVLQKVVDRLYTARSNLKKKKDKGHDVGKLKWKGSGYYHSFEYNQSGFELIGSFISNCHITGRDSSRYSVLRLLADLAESAVSASIDQARVGA